MWPSLLPSQRAQVAGAIPPQSTSTTITTGWFLISNWEWLLAVIDVGVISSGGSVAASFKQATSSGGAGAKAVTDAAGNALAITAMTQAGGNSSEQALINAEVSNFDTNNGFIYGELSITVSTAAALVEAVVLGFDPKVPTADSTGNGSAASSVNQVVAQP